MFMKREIDYNAALCSYRQVDDMLSEEGAKMTVH